MRVTPGQPIPFWFRLWDGRSDRFVVAHLTDTAGVEQPGSPYLLTHVQRGIYVANGPLIGVQNLNIDYETYVDEDFTQLDNRYLPNSDLAEADISNMDVLAAILGKLSAASPDTINAQVVSTIIQGSVDVNTQSGVVAILSTNGTVDNSVDSGEIDNGTVIQGEL